MNMRKKYIKKFNTQSEYFQFVNSLDFVIPNVSYISSLNHVYFNNSYDNQYLTFIATQSGTFTFTPQNSNVISYSIDNGTTWTQGNSVNVSSGDAVMWKGTMIPSSDGIGTFSSTNNFIVLGNAMSLLFGDNYSGQTSLSGKAYAFNSLFESCTRLTSIENLSLPATTLENWCYLGMFLDCTSLTSIPSDLLPATTLADGCYGFMFIGCKSLKSIPSDLLPATTLTQFCYRGMFRNCRSLVTAPELPATTLATYCYANMFCDCDNLTTAPELPATTLAISCYDQMFDGCISLETAPVLPATTLVSSCYYGMFSGCTSLNSITCLATYISSDSCTYYWVEWVVESGTFTKAASMTSWTTGEHGIPSGWTVQNAS